MKNPTTDDAKKAAGTFTPARARTPMSVPLGAPAAPEWLSKEAAEEWELVVNDLAASGCLAKADRLVLAMYAELAAQFRLNAAEMPAAKLTQLRLIAGELGLSPAARLKIRAPETPADPPAVRPRKDGKVVSIRSLLARDEK